MNSLFQRPFWQLSVLTGILIGISYPPLHLGFFAWIGFIPLIFVLLNVSPWPSFKYSYLASITANSISLYWIGFNSGAGFGPVFASLVGAILYLGIFWALFGLILSWIHRRSGYGFVILPFLWVTMEWIRSFGALGFPWINLALTQTDYLPLIQIAEITGTYGVAFWLMLINMGLYLLLFNKNEKRKILFTTGLIFFSMWIIGVYRYYTVLNNISDKQFKVAVVQPNLDPNEKWDREYRKRNFTLMHSLLDEALLLLPDLVLWPETAVPTKLRLNQSSRFPIQQKVVKSGIPLLSGTVDRTIGKDGEKTYYNGTILMNPDESIQMYYKVQLVPFAEYVPLSGYFPIIKKLNLGLGNFTPGEEYTIFEVDSIKLSNVICYESSLPQVVSEFVRKGAQFMTIQANDGWLGSTSGPYQHFELAKLRAVENRISIARSANTGISGIILPTGHVQSKIPIGAKKVFLGSVPILDNPSIYALYGDIFAMFITCISIMIVGFSWVKRS